jgi:hypothetical protein
MKASVHIWIVVSLTSRYLTQFMMKPLGLLYALQHHHLALSFRLHHSNVVIGRNTLKNPICVVANYLFDTLCHDIFQASAYIVSLFTNHAAWKHRLKPVKSKKV